MPLIAQTIEHGWATQQKPRGAWEWGTGRPKKYYQAVPCCRQAAFRVRMHPTTGKLVWEREWADDWNCNSDVVNRKCGREKLPLIAGIKPGGAVTARQAAKLSGIKSKVALDWVMDNYDS